MSLPERAVPAVKQSETPAVQQQPFVPIISMGLEAATKFVAEMRAFVARHLKEGEDFGKVPGAQKPSLWKAGAENLCGFAGLAPEFEILEQVENWDKGFFYYKVKCRLIYLGTGQVVAEGMGSCNSMEDKYRWRWAFENEVPAHIDKGTLKSKRFQHKGKWYTKYRIENDDVYTLVNTILKMAEKRAHIDATLRATRTSAIFTQDIEDMPGVVEEEASPAQEEPQASKPQGAQKPQTPKPKTQQPAAAPAAAQTPAANGNGSAPPNWTKFWARMKELGLTNDQVRQMAGEWMQEPELKSLTQVIKNQADLDMLREYIESAVNPMPPDDMAPPEHTAA